MTLAQRNLYFKGGIALAFVCLALLGIFAAKILPLFPELCGEALYRTAQVLQNPAADIFPAAPMASFAALAIALVYALFALALVFFLFEKTHAPEILFFGLFALSFAFEILRILVPLQRLYSFSYSLLFTGSRLLFFGRLFGVLSLFVASLFAVGIDIQKQGQVVIAMLFAVLLVVLRIPISGQSWDTSLAMISGYSSMIHLTEMILMGITILSFLVAAYTKEIKEYYIIALGVLLISLGRTLLIPADTWAASALGFVLLITGTWFSAQRLHSIYLWL
jgi:hypothetical protein